MAVTKVITVSTATELTRMTTARKVTTVMRATTARTLTKVTTVTTVMTPTLATTVTPTTTAITVTTATTGTIGQQQQQGQEWQQRQYWLQWKQWEQRAQWEEAKGGDSWQSCTIILGLWLLAVWYRVDAKLWLDSNLAPKKFLCVISYRGLDSWSALYLFMHIPSCKYDYFICEYDCEWYH